MGWRRRYEGVKKRSSSSRALYIYDTPLALFGVKVALSPRDDCSFLGIAYRGGDEEGERR